MQLDHLLSSNLAPAQEEIKPHLDAADMLALRSVSKDVHRSLKEDISPLVYNIDNKLKKFFDDPKYFRQILAQTSALVGGDYARAFFDNRTSSVNKLDIYVHRVKDKREKASNLLVGYLTTAGYASSSPIDHDEHGPADLVLEKAQSDGTTLAVVLHMSEHGPLNQLLNEALTTASLNFIAWNRAYSLFPQQTFANKTAYLLRNLENDEQGEYFRNHLNALTEIGIRTMTLDWEDEYGDEDITLTRVRRIGDKYTWSIDLDVTDMKAHMAPSDSVLECSTFKLQKFVGSHSKRGPFDRYTMNAAALFRHPTLKHIYVTVGIIPVASYERSEDCPFANKVYHLRNKLGGVTQTELIKLPNDKRPPQEDFDNYLGHGPNYYGVCPSNLVWDENAVPKTWSFYDDLLVKQLSKLWKAHEREEEQKVKARHEKAAGGSVKEEEEEEVGNDWDQEPAYAGDI